MQFVDSFHEDSSFEGDINQMEIKNEGDLLKYQKKHTKMNLQRALSSKGQINQEISFQAKGSSPITNKLGGHFKLFINNSPGPSLITSGTLTPQKIGEDTKEEDSTSKSRIFNFLPVIKIENTSSSPSKNNLLVPKSTFNSSGRNTPIQQKQNERFTNSLSPTPQHYNSYQQLQNNQYLTQFSSNSKKDQSLVKKSSFISNQSSLKKKSYLGKERVKFIGVEDLIDQKPKIKKLKIITLKQNDQEFDNEDIYGDSQDKNLQSLTQLTSKPAPSLFKMKLQAELILKQTSLKSQHRYSKSDQLPEIISNRKLSSESNQSQQQKQSVRKTEVSLQSDQSQNSQTSINSIPKILSISKKLVSDLKNKKLRKKFKIDLKSIYQTPDKNIGLNLQLLNSKNIITDDISQKKKSFHARRTSILQKLIKNSNQPTPNQLSNRQGTQEQTDVQNSNVVFNFNIVKEQKQFLPDILKTQQKPQNNIKQKIG
eukprot:403372654